MAFRNPTGDELRLLKELASIAELGNSDAWVKALVVEEIDDGGMGSLRLRVADTAQRSNGLVSCKAAVQFTDEDGIEVIASLNADNYGTPFELDMWKTDFSPLVRIPPAFRRVHE